MSDDSTIRPFDSNLSALILRTYNDFGLLRSDYTILIIAAVEAIIEKLRMNRGLVRLL
jgi:hypothetical protein